MSATPRTGPAGDSPSHPTHGEHSSTASTNRLIDSYRQLMPTIAEWADGILPGQPTQCRHRKEDRSRHMVTRTLRLCQSFPEGGVTGVLLEEPRE